MAGKKEKTSIEFEKSSVFPTCTCINALILSNVY